MKRSAWLLAASLTAAATTAVAQPAVVPAPPVAVAPVAVPAPVAAPAPVAVPAPVAAPVPVATAVHAPAPATTHVFAPAAAHSSTSATAHAHVPAVATVPAPAASPAPAVAPAAPPPAAVPAPVVAAPPAAPPASASPSWLRPDKSLAKPALETQHGPSPLRVSAMLLLVAGLGGVAFYARKRGQKLATGEQKAHLRVLGTTRVGAKAQAVVVEVAGKRLLLGVTDQAVSTLAWLDDEQNAALDDSREASGVNQRTGAQSLDDVAAAGPSGFLKLLRNAVGTGAAPKPAAPSIPRAAVDEIVKATRDEVRLSSRREPPPEEPVAFEGQVMGLARRRKDTP